MNKGLGGGGYGPVITLGSVFAGVIEKSATGIATLADGFAGVGGDLTIVPSLWAGAFPAGVLAPYAVRVLPNRIWQYLIPVYARHRRGIALLLTCA